ncbi:N-acetylmuramoyl-L-alanine amidase [Fluviicola chungangensis]|uniref:N-acetylmuramoyl-L-alanine amidase n=1 Tax=Fluviicola chungangensis TaxID=2597671 RepID=A0A556N3S0_9FLAO|nr:N-acetylmuramoyl-L-alanine amidase [Fluviicola chungangensis]TSJ46683.1 T9SS type A sorting domain-containing protein [Fluviicola chungangensis]
MKKLLLFASLLGFHSFAQTNTDFENLCQQAYAAYPAIPKGVIEAVSFTQTRMSYLADSELESCSGLPKSRGFLGMVARGKGYFKENMKLVSQLSGIPVSQIRQDPAAEINAFAKVINGYVTELKGMSLQNTLKEVFSRLSYLPDSGRVNIYARDAELYELFRFLNNDEYAVSYHFPNYNFDLVSLFGAENLAVLSAQRVIFSEEGIRSDSGHSYLPVKKESILKSTEYAPAIWNPAPSCNFSSRNGTAISAITIHTIQGTYAGAISWSQNCSSSVSYHYVVRSSDGQVTQMVLEASKAWHVGSENPYTIGYEHEGYVSQSQWYTTALYNASAGITRDICQSGYGINPLRTFSGAATSGTNVLGGCIKIKGHQHYPNQTHTDPGIYWNWALYYQLVNNNPVQSNLTTVSGTFTDSGGSSADYSNDQRYFTLIQPANASSITLNFSSFSLETNWDYLYIYDGATTSSPLIGTYTGTNSPGTISSTGGALLIEFRSDCATTASGWVASWSSTISNPGPGDLIAPTTVIAAQPAWITQDFTATFTDADNACGSGIEKAYYQVIDFDGTDWRANSSKGFFSDNFDQNAIHSDWTVQTGTWALGSSHLIQNDESNGNTNIWTPVSSTLSNRYLYHWTGAMSGSGTNRRAGLHYFCSDPTLPNRGNSYFVFFRLDNDKVQLYEVTNDTYALVDEVSYDFNAGQWYDYKIIYDRISGKHQVYVDNVLVQTWTDTTPLASGESISFRSGNCVYEVNDLKVYRSRALTVPVSVGTGNDIRYQSISPSSPSGRIKSIVQDQAGNLSAIQSLDLKVDWTVPATIASVFDGLSADITTTTNNSMLEANWTVSSDPHSDVANYWVAIGTAPGGTDVVSWTNNYWNTTISIGGLNLSVGTTYYVSVKAENGAGLFSAISTSDGQTVVLPTNPPNASFILQNTYVCSTDSLVFQNTSVDGVSYLWSFQGGSPAASSEVNPKVQFPASGSYQVQLIAYGPNTSDTIQQLIDVVVSLPVTAQFSLNDDTLYLPNAVLYCTNLSSNANGYNWNFGEGTQSQDENPWHTYSAAGNYELTLIAVNDACPGDTMNRLIRVIDFAGIDDPENQVFHVYPNPAADFVTIELTESGGTLLVMDGLGRIVREKKLDTATTDLKISDLAGGMYQLVYVIDGKRVQKSIVKR